MKSILLTISLFLTLFTMGCEFKFSSLGQYPIVYTDTLLFKSTRDSIGAESIHGYMTTYTDTCEHVLVKITITNAAEHDVLSQNTKVTRAIAARIIKSIGFDDDFDSLNIKYVHKTSEFVFSTEKSITYGYGPEFIYAHRRKLFKEEIRWCLIYDSLYNNNDIKRMHEVEDSLSNYSAYRTVVISMKINTLVKESDTNFTKPREMTLKALASRPMNSGLILQLGCIYYYEKNYELAAKYLETTLRRMPNHRIANAYRGFVYYAEGDYVSAMKHYKIAKQNGSERVDDEIEYLSKQGY